MFRRIGSKKASALFPKKLRQPDPTRNEKLKIKKPYTKNSSLFANSRASLRMSVRYQK